MRKKSSRASNSPFFIGWEGPGDTDTRRWLRRWVWTLLSVLLILGFTLASSQRTIGEGIFEFGTVREFRGLFLGFPTPMLIADEPVSGQTLFYLVNEFKHGLDPEEGRRHHLRRVRLSGTLIRDPLEAMIEVVAGSFEVLEGEPLADPRLDGQRIQQLTLQGEIVDSKCQLGVMNPGRLKPHRACAVHCIRGGIPPLLRIEDEAGELAYVLLVGERGQPINQEVLQFIALPVEVSGKLRKFGDRNVLFVDLGSLRKKVPGASAGASEHRNWVASPPQTQLPRSSVLPLPRGPIFRSCSLALPETQRRKLETRQS